jgi:hypothetical protein
MKGSGQTTTQILQNANFLELLAIFVVLFSPVIFVLIIYYLVFRDFKFGNPIENFKITWIFLTRMPSQEEIESYDQRGGEDDEWYDIYGEDDTYARPRARYPKNVDRAYNGGAERFHHGGR